MTQGGRPVEILLVEDNEADVRLTREAFKQTRVPNNLHVAEDGEQAMGFLRRDNDDADAARPDLVLLDLNLPRKNGHDVLKEIKSDDDLKTIPVVVMTTSREVDDIVLSYAGHANCYIRKPMSVAGLVDVVRSIEHFWFEIVSLPAEG